MKLYEAAGAGRSQGASPYVWRIKMLLAHLGLSYESERLFMIEHEEKLAFAQPEAKRLGTSASYAPHGTVPVLVDGDTILPDSWTIAAYLDGRYGEGSLVNAHDAINRFIEQWTMRHVSAVVGLNMIKATVEAMDECDREHFRTTRRELLGVDIDQVHGTVEDCAPALRDSLHTLEETLAAHDFLGGASPMYADYIVFSHFVWFDHVSSVELLDAKSALHRWRGRLMDAHGGLARQ